MKIWWLPRIYTMARILTCEFSFSSVPDTIPVLWVDRDPGNIVAPALVRLALQSASYI